MNKEVKPVPNRQLLLVGCSLCIIFVFTILIIFVIGFIINMVFLSVVTFYIRGKRPKRSDFGFGDKLTGGGGGGRQRLGAEDKKLRYVCFLCASEVFDRTCRTCGSHMKKPVF